jgi:hypothetical protein
VAIENITSAARELSAENHMVAIKHAPLAQRAMMAAVAVELKKKVSAIARVQSACARAGVMQLVLGLALGLV